MIHLLVSALIVGNVVAVVFWVWYPAPAFEIFGAFSIIRLLIIVDLVLGPLLTLVVYKHGKPGLKFDLTIIALVQIVALVYGSYILFSERPRFIVFAVDRLEFVAPYQIDESQIRYDELRNKQIATLIPVYARVPQDPEVFQRYLDSVMYEGQPDLERRAEFWEPWSTGTDTIRSKIRSLQDLQPASDVEFENLQQAIATYDNNDVGVLPVGGIERDIGILIERRTLDIIGVLEVNAWPAE